MILVGGWATPLKNMSSSIGMIRHPIYGKIKLMFQTTNQDWFPQRKTFWMNFGSSNFLEAPPGCVVSLNWTDVKICQANAGTCPCQSADVLGSQNSFQLLDIEDHQSLSLARAHYNSQSLESTSWASHIWCSKSTSRKKEKCPLLQGPSWPCAIGHGSHTPWMRLLIMSMLQ